MKGKKKINKFNRTVGGVSSCGSTASDGGGEGVHEKIPWFTLSSGCRRHRRGWRGMRRRRLIVDDSCRGYDRILRGIGGGAGGGAAAVPRKKREKKSRTRSNHCVHFRDWSLGFKHRTMAETTCRRVLRGVYQSRLDSKFFLLRGLFVGPGLVMDENALL